MIGSGRPCSPGSTRRRSLNDTARSRTPSRTPAAANPSDWPTTSTVPVSTERASRYAAAAGDRATSGLAFAHAARLYRHAREWWEGDPARRRELQVREAEALVNAGRCAEAAALFLAASEGGHPGAALELRQRAAEQFLAGGHFDDGLAVLVPLLTDLGLAYPQSTRNALVRTIGRLVQLRLRGSRFRRRVSREVQSGALVRADVCYSAAKSLCIIDPARGVYFSVLGLMLALRTGEPVRVGRSLALVGGSTLSVAGGAVGRWGRRLMRDAIRLAQRERDPYLVGMTATSMGTVHLVAGEWTRALGDADRGVRLLSDRCRGASFECAIGRMAAMRALEELGRMGELHRRADEMLAAARETGDHYAEVTALTYAAFARLANDDCDGARALARGRLERAGHTRDSTFSISTTCGSRCIATSTRTVPRRHRRGSSRCGPPSKSRPCSGSRSPASTPTCFGPASCSPSPRATRRTFRRASAMRRGWPRSTAPTPPPTRPSCGPPSPRCEETTAWRANSPSARARPTTAPA